MTAALAAALWLASTPAPARDANWAACMAFGAAPDAAIAGCTEILAHGAGEPVANRVHALNNRGNALEAKRDHDRAIADYDEALRLDPAYADAYNGRGNAHVGKGDNDRAIADYDRAIRLNPRFAMPYHGRGNAYLNKGQYEQAIASYGEAIRRDPRYFNPYNGRGLAYTETKRFDQAVADFGEAIRLKPDYVNAYNNRGNAYQKLGRYDEAIADYGAAIRLQPDFAMPYANRANTFMLKKDYDRAIADYDEAIKRDSDYANAYYGRGEAYLEKGDARQAAADFRIVLSLKPYFLDTDTLLAKAEAALGKQPPASAEALGAAPIAPGVILKAAAARRRVALVIGNSAYPGAAVANPANDAVDVTAKLKDLGFDVVTGRDLTLAGFSDAVSRFVGKAEGADVALLYYSGHAMQVNGENWLLPVDTRVGSLFDVQQFNVSLQRLLHTVDTQARTTLVFLDACRNNPFSDRLKATMKAQSRAIADTRGLARITVDSPDTLVVFATQPDDVAADGEGRDSPFTEAFLANVGTPGVEVETLMKRVTADVKAKTGDRQRPERLSGLTTEFYFVAK